MLVQMLWICSFRADVFSGSPYRVRDRFNVSVNSVFPNDRQSINGESVFTFSRNCDCPSDSWIRMNTAVFFRRRKCTLTEIEILKSQSQCALPFGRHSHVFAESFAAPIVPQHDTAVERDSGSSCSVQSTSTNSIFLSFFDFREHEFKATSSNRNPATAGTVGKP